MIVAVGSFQETVDAETIDLENMTVLPAFIDAHVHLRSQDVLGGENLLAWAKNGVAAVKDLGIFGSISLEEHMEWIKRYPSTKYATVSTAGKYIDVDGGYGMGPVPGMKIGIEIATPEQAAAAVKSQYKAGVHGIKVGINEEREGLVRKLLSEDEMKAISSKAKELKLWVSCHVTRSADLRIAVEAGFTEAAHSPGDVMDDELIELMVTRNVSMTTTAGKRVDLGKAPDFLPPWVSSAAEYMKVRKKQFANILDNLKRFYLAGGVIQIGTDYMSVTDFEETAAKPVW